MIHDSFSDDDIEVVRDRILTVLAARAPHIALLSVKLHVRGGYAVHFDCPEVERVPLAEHLVEGGFRHVI